MSCADCEDCTIQDAPVAATDPEVCNHELHVTVHNDGDFDRFRDVCVGLGLRPLVMGIRDLDRKIHVEFMTGSGFEGTDDEARRALAEVGDSLVGRGYDPIRAKIESAPWHPRAVVRQDGWGLPRGTYWESHVGLWLRPNVIDKVHRTIYLANGYLSRNERKPARESKTHPGVMERRWSATLRAEFLSRENQVTQTEFIAGLLREDGANVDEGIRHEWTWIDRCYDYDMPGGPPTGARPS